MMKIRKFVASSVPQALRQVRDDLGDRAVILNTRTLPGGRGTEVRVEVTAALDGDPVRELASASATTAEVGGRAPSLSPSRADLLGRVYGRSAPAATAEPEAPRWRDEADGGRHLRSAAQWLASLPSVTREARVQREPSAPPSPRPAPGAAEGPVASPAATDPVVIRQLRQLEEVVHRMARQTTGFELPPEVARLGERLRRTGLIERHVHRCLHELMGELSAEGRDDGDAVAQAAAAVLTRMLPERRDLRIGKGRRVVALVGPSGSGKSTAAAKIAAGFISRRRQRGESRAGEIVLVNTDTRRVGALAQARDFADLVGAPLETAYDEVEMARVVAAYPEARLVLVDTPGCGPHERRATARHRRLLEAAGADEVQVVVDGLSGFEHILDVVEAWGAGGMKDSCRLLLAKMDQVARPGVAVSAAIECGLSTSYLTVGACVPGGIRPGDLTPFAEWMTGRRTRPFVGGQEAG